MPPQNSNWFASNILNQFSCIGKLSNSNKLQPKVKIRKFKNTAKIAKSNQLEYFFKYWREGNYYEGFLRLGPISNTFLAIYISWHSNNRTGLYTVFYQFLLLKSQDSVQMITSYCTLHYPSKFISSVGKNIPFLMFLHWNKISSWTR